MQNVAINPMRQQARSQCRKILNVKIRSTAARRRRLRIAGRLVAAFMILTLVCSMGWFGVSKVLDKFFFSNPAYNLRELTLELDGIMTGEDLVTVTGIEVGENIFCVNLHETEKRLREIPMVADVCVERILPDKVKITLTSRHPVAWISPQADSNLPYDPETMLLTDNLGLLMKPRMLLPDYHNLPIIYGVNPSEINEGEPLHNDDLKKALMLLAVARQSSDSLLVIRSLNIAKGYCIDAITDQNSRVKFGSEDFPDQLEKLNRLLEHCRDTGRALDSVNLMVRKNTPVKFVMVSPPQPIQTASQEVKSKPTSPKIKGKKN